MKTLFNLLDLECSFPSVNSKYYLFKEVLQVQFIKLYYLCLGLYIALFIIKFLIRHKWQVSVLLGWPGAIP
jgi:hypothetical protein